MRNLNETFTDAEFRRLERAKDCKTQTWHDYLLSLVADREFLAKKIIEYKLSKEKKNND